MSGIMLAILGRSGGAAGYTYVFQTTGSSGSIAGGTTVLGATALPTQPTNTNNNRLIGVVADGTFIANTIYYSTNNGSSWAQYQSPAGSVMSTPFGLNGSIAYSTVSKKAMAANTGVSKGGYNCAPYVVSRTGTVQAATQFTIGAGAFYFSVSYSPALNTFYVNNWGGGGNMSEYRHFDGTSITGGGSVSPGNPGNYRAGISKDGYPLLAISIGGGNWSLREYTSADLSAYTTIGNVSGITNAVSSPFYWLPVNNKYVTCKDGGGTVNVFTATSANPEAYTSLGTLSLGGIGATSMSIFEDASGLLVLSGTYFYNSAKAVPTEANYTAKSTDGGVTWTMVGIGATFGASKNFT